MITLDKIYNMDCITGMKLMDDNSIDAVVTDPPYGLEFMGKEWDKFKEGKNIAGGTADKSTPYSRAEKGRVPPSFYQLTNSNKMEMQQFFYEWATEALRVLKPGAHLLSFGGSRTYHRMACAIEDAGFEIRDQIMWVYGSGFPKSLNVGKAIDKLQGNEREVVGKGKPMKSLGVMHDDEWKSDNDYNETKGTSDWEGWGTALKPAHEPIVLARKPLSEPNVALNVLKWGTGGINVDGCRIALNGTKKTSGGCKGNRIKLGYGFKQKNNTNNDIGRFPANFIHDGSDEVTECFPETKSTPRTATVGGTGGVGVSTNFQRESETSNHNDSGNASRFFYCAKASKAERDMGLMGSFINIEVYIIYTDDKCKEKNLIKEERLAKLQVDMEQSQIKVIDAFGIQKKNDIEWNTTLFGKKLMEQFQKDIIFTIKTKIQSITISQILNWLTLYFIKEYTLGANSLKIYGGNPVENVEPSKELKIIMNEKLASALGVNHVVSEMQLRIKLNEKRNRCDHPTVKPIALMQYLIKLVTPPNGIVLDPFLGSGTTAIAAYKEHKQFIGFEKEKEYCDIAEARLKPYITQKRSY